MHDMPCGMTVGDEVLRDEPLAVFPPTACWSGEDDEAIVERLAPDERKRVMGLADAFHSPPTVAGIIRTNSIPLTLGSEDKDASSRGLFPLACRLNHACAGASNSRFVWRDDLQVVSCIFTCRAVCERACIYRPTDVCKRIYSRSLARSAYSSWPCERYRKAKK